MTATIQQLPDVPATITVYPYGVQTNLALVDPAPGPDDDPDPADHRHLHHADPSP